MVMNVYVKEGEMESWRWGGGDEDVERERERFGEWRVYLGYNVCLYVYI